MEFSYNIRSNIKNIKILYHKKKRVHTLDPIERPINNNKTFKFIHIYPLCHIMVMNKNGSTRKWNIHLFSFYILLYFTLLLFIIKQSFCVPISCPPHESALATSPLILEFFLFFSQ